MTDIEKLIELIGGFRTYAYLDDDSDEHIEVGLAPRTVEHLADYLISKGVTIPVKCGECKHFHRALIKTIDGSIPDFGICDHPWFDSDKYDVYDSHFCGYGERE